MTRRPGIGRDLLSDRALARPGPLCQLVIYNDHSPASWIIVLGKEASFEESRADGFERARRDRTIVGHRRYGIVFTLPCDVRSAPVRQVVVWQVTDRASGRDAWQRGDPRLQFPAELVEQVRESIGVRW